MRLGTQLIERKSPGVINPQGRIFWLLLMLREHHNDARYHINNSHQHVTRAKYHS